MNSKKLIKSISTFLIILLFNVCVFAENDYENWSSEADKFLSLGEFDQAFELVNAMIKAKSKEGVWDEVIFGELKKTEIYKLTSKRKERLVHAQRAIDLTIIHYPDDEVLKALSYTELGRAHWRMGNIPSAVKNLDKGKDYMASLEGWDRYVGILCDFAAIYFDQGKLEKVERVLDEAYQTANDHLEEDDFHYGNIYNWKQKLFFKKGNYEASLTSLKEAMKYTGIAKKKANLLFNIASIYRLKGDHDRALSYYFQSLNLISSLNIQDTLTLVDTYNKIGEVYSQKEDYDDAIINIGKAIDYLDAFSGAEKEASYIYVYNNLAFALMGKSSDQKVIPILKKNLVLHRKSPVAKEATLLYLSRAYRINGEFNQARIYQNQSIEAHRKLYGDIHPEIGIGYRHLGWMDAQEGKLTSALGYYQKALGIIALDFNDEAGYSNPPISAVENLTQLYYILQNKGIALKKNGEEKQSEELLKASLDTYELAANVVDNMLENYQEGSKKFWIATIRPIYEQALGVAAELYKNGGKTEYLEKAFYFAERGRAVLLRESLKESIAKRQGLVDPKALEMEKQIKIDLAFYRKQIFQEESKKSASDTSKILAWRSNIFNLNQRWDSIKTKLNPAKGNNKNQIESKTIFSLPEVQKNLADSTMLLEYVLGDSIAYILAIDNQSVRLISTKEDILKPLIPFIKQIKDLDEVSENGLSVDFFTKYQREAKKLYDLLLKPVLSDNYKNLIIIPDGILGYLPFETLVTEYEPSLNDKPDYRKVSFLLEEVDIRYEYSASLLEELNRDQPSQGFTGFAPIYSSEFAAETRDGENRCELLETYNFANLSNNRKEVRNIAKLIRGKMFNGRKATESKFLEIAPESQVLHLAMHGFINECDPLYSGLAFTGSSLNTQEVEPSIDTTNHESDDLLYAYEIYNLSLKADLTVLSACNTGSGQSVEGEGIMSLARAFKYAGCANVVMSLWQADDKSTAYIMEAFYRNLKGGMGKSKALKEAKLDYVKNHLFSHPFFWGGFVLIGDNQAMELASSLWLIYGAIIVGILLLGIGGVIIWRRRKLAQNKIL